MKQANKRIDILGIGVAAVDDLVYLEHYPQPDSKMPVNSSQRQGGGLTATALVAAARQGAKAAYLGRLGDDELSRYTIGELEREGVNCSLVVRDPGGKPVHSIILVDLSTGTRTILYSQIGLSTPDVQSITQEIISGCRILFMDHYSGEGGLHAARIAHQAQIPVVADVENDEAPGIDELLGLVDHLIVGEGVGGRLSGQKEPVEMVRALARPRRACTVVTAGDRGCWFTENGSDVQHVPAFKIKVVDTTGCGDVFHGSYAAAIARGEPVCKSVLIASATAGLKAAQPGGRAGIPDLTTAENFIKNNGA